MDDYSLKFSPQFTSTKRNLIVFSLLSIFLALADVTIKGYGQYSLLIEIHNQWAIPVMLIVILIYLGIKYWMYINQEIKIGLHNLKKNVRKEFCKQYAIHKLNSMKSSGKLMDWSYKSDSDFVQLSYYDTDQLYGVKINYSAHLIDENKNKKKEEKSDFIDGEELSALSAKFEKDFVTNYPNHLEVFTPVPLCIVGIACCVYVLLKIVLTTC